MSARSLACCRHIHLAAAGEDLGEARNSGRTEVVVVVHMAAVHNSSDLDNRIDFVVVRHRYSSSQLRPVAPLRRRSIIPLRRLISRWAAETKKGSDWINNTRANDDFTRH